MVMEKWQEDLEKEIMAKGKPTVKEPLVEEEVKEKDKVSEIEEEEADQVYSVEMIPKGREKYYGIQ